MFSAAARFFFFSGEQFLLFLVLALTQFAALRTAESPPGFLVGAGAAPSFPAQRQRARSGRDGHPGAARLQVRGQEQRPDHREPPVFRS